MPGVTVQTLADRSWFLGKVELDPRVVAFDPGIFALTPTTVRLWRPDDLVLLRLKLHNLAISGPAGAQRIAPVDPGKPAYLGCYHQPQSFAEQAYPDSSPTEVPNPLAPGDLPAQIIASGRSRVVYRFPAGTADWDGTPAGLLDGMTKWPLARVPLKPPATGGIRGVLDRSPFAALAKAAVEAAVFSGKPQLAEIVSRAVRRTVQTTRTLTPDSARSLALSLGQTVDAIAQAARLGAQDAVAVGQAAEVQLAAALGDRFRDRIDLGDLVSIIPGLRILFKPRQPTQTETAIELPYRLALSPIEDKANFDHALHPVTKGEGRPRTELWHSRLGSGSGPDHHDATEQAVAVAAIWTPDLAESGVNPPFLTSLSRDDRMDLVRLTADETLKRGNGLAYRPSPAKADRLMLTALGGWLDVEGKWDPRPLRPDQGPVSLYKWSHQAAMGRDYAVQVVHVGHLLPFGHRAAVLEITERRFQPHPDGGRVAVLRKRLQVVVQEPELRFPRAGQPADGRELPFVSVEILTRKTPNLVAPNAQETTSSFWPRIQVGATPAQAEDFRFAVRTTDLSGAVSRFDLPMRFVSESGSMTGAVESYNGSDQNFPGRTTADLRKQVVHLAPGDGPVAFPIETFRFGTVNAPGWIAGSSTPRVYPRVGTVTLISTEIGQITGGEGVGEFAYAGPWVSGGFGPGNPGEVFLATTAQPLEADLGGGGQADKTGGFVMPSFGVVGMSRAFGHVGGGTAADVTKFSTDGFDPNSWFPSAKIFGGIDLKDLLVPVALLAASAIPKLKTVRSPDKIETSFDYLVESLPNEVLILKMNKGGTSTFNIKVAVVAHLKVADVNPAINKVGSGPGDYARDAGLADPDASVDAKLTFFKFDFFGAIIVSFDAFAFKVSKAKGFEPDPKLAGTDPVVFGGPLTFLEELRKSVFGGGSSGGGGGGGGGASGPSFGFKPIIKLEDGGLTVGGKFGVPSVVVGVFTLKNVMASAAIKIPFDGRSVGFVFGFAERQNPFQLTVSMFGGGGFVLLGLDAKGVQEIEAALEFGAFAAIDLGIASGGIYVKGGFYFHWKAADRLTVFVGYIEMGGEVQALGIISVSIVLNLSLGFYKQGTKSLVKGQALLTIEVEVLFFSISASVTVERSFDGSDSDPRFVEFVPTVDVWNEYAEAFA